MAGAAAAASASAREALSPGTPGALTKLGDIAHVPLLMKESPVRVREIWLEKFQDDASEVAGTMAKEEYDAISGNAGACPMFLFPVPRGDGYLNFVWQVQGDRILYQTLESAQRGGAADIDLGVAMFTDLLDSHQMVLLKGTLQSGRLSREEAARAIRLTRESYLDPARFSWVKRFNLQPREFDYEEFLAEFKPLERWHAAGG
ncbi:unnamed protein product [Prorocentrum cordatum]|uniref:Uncharacterized protein n=1 Tax=Prorocentrum cordatum TaxID=2364126 RepID=A0ABN9VJU4_9DINO|nr:unnamed protein product [Polarella glacialis]